MKDREAWRAAVHGDHKESDTTERLNNNNNKWALGRKTTKVKCHFLIAYHVNISYQHIIFHHIADDACVGLLPFRLFDSILKDFFFPTLCQQYDEK